MKQLFFSLLSLLVIWTSCNSLTKGFELEGELKNAANMQMTLEKVEFSNNLKLVGTTQVDGAGKFKLKLEEKPLPGVYMVKAGNKRLLLFFDGSEKEVKLTGDYNNLEKYDINVTGSKGSKDYAELMKKLASQSVDQNYLKNYVVNGQNTLINATLSFQVLFNELNANLPAVNKIADNLDKEFPGSSYAKDYRNVIAQVKTKMDAEASAMKIKIGELAPEINLPGPDGKKHSLAALKGKVVLLDFWASWCGPCRRENPHVVSVYNQFKDKGFTVFSVSLDGGGDPAQGTAAWKNAIAQDKLVWENHVSDLKKWQSEPAAMYGVQSIPQTFLLDKEGKIAAINPRENLEAEVAKLLK
ncbi:MAG: AhpC/TSA family protein [Saprospiraceae bacterium]|nr:AhpC/TSA family protein [Saprospiraceae bacterium]